MPNHYLLRAMAATPKDFKRLIRLIPAARHDERLHADRFTPREVIAHLADWEPVFLGRMKAAKETPGTEVPVYDEGDWAIEHGYGQSDEYAMADLFLQRRTETVRWLETLSPEDLKLSFSHPELGDKSIEDWANTMLAHDMYHVDQLMEYIDPGETKA